MDKTAKIVSLLSLYILVLLLPLPVHAGEFIFLPDHPGRLSATVTGSHLDLNKTDAAAFKRNLDRLRNLLAKQPVFNPPRGVEVKGYFRPNDQQPKNNKLPIPGFGYLRFHFYHVGGKTGKPVHICCTTDEIFVSVNDPDTVLDMYGGSGFPPKAFYEPLQVGDLDGFPIYRMDNGNEVLVIKRSKIPPWIPVTREEFVASWLKYWQKAAAGSPLDTLSPLVVDSHEEALAGMSPAEKKMQARSYPGDPREPTLAPVGSDEGRALVKSNPAWFDPSLPRGAFQLITLRFSYTNLNHEAPGPSEHGNVAPYRVWQALHESNWSEISKALTDR